MQEFFEKMALSDDDYEFLTKGIAMGVGIGIIIGAIIGNVMLTFAAGGVLGIIGGFMYSFYKKYKQHSLKVEKVKVNK